MNLIEDGTLEKSSVVANCCMNHERNLHGSNGYDKELRCDPLDVLRSVAAENGQASWLDLCCGTGKALIQATSTLESEGVTIDIVGVDLAGLFLPADSKRLRLVQASLTDWEWPCKKSCVSYQHSVEIRSPFSDKESDTWMRNWSPVLSS